MHERRFLVTGGSQGIGAAIVELARGPATRSCSRGAMDS